MVQKTSDAPGSLNGGSAREGAPGAPTRRRGGRPPKEKEDALERPIRANVTRREMEHLRAECRRINLTRRLSFAGFVREKLVAGTAAPAKADREALLLETLQRLQDCRLALSTASGGANAADQPALATTQLRIEKLIDQLATWWFD